LNNPRQPQDFSPNIARALLLLNEHFESFWSIQPLAIATSHPVPMDTRGWSQILASLLSGYSGLSRQKGADLSDGSDVKGANTWEAIDTPRFNGVIKSGTLSETSDDIASLDIMPNLYLVLWDKTPRETYRCRVWVVNTQQDQVFRAVARNWYNKKITGVIKSSNFQLHPPRGLDSNTIRNTCGNLNYPLLLSAERFCLDGESEDRYHLVEYSPNLITDGRCQVCN